MARKDKSLAGLFETNEEEVRNSNADPQENYLEPAKDEPSDKFISADAKELEPVKPSFNEIIERKRKRLTIEDTHKRQTYFIRRDLIKEIEQLSKKEPRGFKTDLVNYAIEKLLREEFGKDI